MVRVAKGWSGATIIWMGARVITCVEKESCCRGAKDPQEGHVDDAGPTFLLVPGTRDLQPLSVVTIPPLVGRGVGGEKVVTDDRW